MSENAPYEQGYQQGLWTIESVHRCGFVSAFQCLQHQESVHQERVQSLSKLLHGKAAWYEQFYEGIIAGTRASLGVLILQGL